MSIRAVLAVVCLLAVHPAAASAELRPGQPFPDIVLPALDGPERSIADFHGRKIALHVFASW